MSSIFFYTLRFKDQSEEATFFEQYFDARKAQIYAVLAGIFWYLAFLWDKFVDPIGAVNTQLIRGIFLMPLFFGVALSLFSDFGRKYCELILVGASVISLTCYAVILSLLKNGFDYGGVGIAIIFLGSSGQVRVRLEYTVVFCLLSWIFFDLIQLYSTNGRLDVFIINNLIFLISTVLLITSEIVGETSARKKFLLQKKLLSSQKHIEYLINAVLPADAVKRIQSRLERGAKTPKIIISYRRHDSSAITGRIRDRLAAQYGSNSVFMDIDNIPFGTNFTKQIEDALKEADVLVAIIGHDWVGKQNDGSWRINNQSDFIRIEIESAFRQGIPILPVLVEGAPMVDADALPVSIRHVALINAVEVDSGRDFGQHMERLTRAIDQIFQQR